MLYTRTDRKITVYIFLFFSLISAYISAEEVKKESTSVDSPANETSSNETKTADTGNQNDDEHEGEGVSPQAAGSEKLKSESPDTNETKEERATGDWCGYRPYFEKKGIIFRSTFVLDSSWNLHGGKKTRAFPSLQYWFDANVTIKSDPLFAYKGGTFFIDFQSHRGENPSDRLVGSTIKLDTIEARNLDQIESLWYRQTFGCKQKNWILVGKSDAYENFTRTQHSQIFLNGGFNSLPTISFFPTYPDPAMSILLCFDFLESIELTMGVFDGALARGAKTGQMGPFGHFGHLDRHAFLIGELNLNWIFAHKRALRLGLGSWYHTARFRRFDDHLQKGTWGPYFTLDQILYKNKENEISFFLLYGSANPHINPFERYIGAGLHWEGVFCRSEDEIGIGFSQGQFTSDERAPFHQFAETFYEFVYKWQFCSWAYLAGDFQYIVHPGGKRLPNASVLTLRLQANL